MRRPQVRSSLFRLLKCGPFGMSSTTTVTPQKRQWSPPEPLNQPWVLLRLICIVRGSERGRVSLSPPTTCADSCFLTGNKHPTARLVYVALQWDSVCCARVMDSEITSLQSGA